ncbi:winged helix-turn-helix domain-containing protein [Sphingomicrobium clamense]|uniref:Transcriptional regulator n=1 Tax=Sphingomicrobium clamense TaxID=2851013 RepID=A0ABS6V384_9SPHN|nr:transcriptional regulator [Sphingomicrobium sp. B8]MBW0144018.1 transcriptional regulator [Sphingomicrobium sp. B8]
MQYRFGPFHFDPTDRRLTRDGVPVDLSSRYLDALALMIAVPGTLITKQRFMDEVWKGVPVTDEALTQAIRALRKALDDDAANPRWIETVPKHGYRFVGELEGGSSRPMAGIWSTGVAGAAGGAVAGVLGGFAYALAGWGNAFLVLVVLTGLLGAIGGAGIGLGIGVARSIASASMVSTVAGGAAGGLIVGALARLIGIDAFTLFFGKAPMAMTGALEGLILGAAVGLVVARAPQRRRSLFLLTALAGGVAGLTIAALGGRLMAGSLSLLFATFPETGIDFAMPFTFPGGLWVTVGVTTIEAIAFVALASLALSSVEKGARQP